MYTITQTRILGVAFDLEGTVVDVEAAHHEGHFATAAEFGVTLNHENVYGLVPHFIGGPDSKVAEDILALISPERRTGLSADDVLARDRFHYERLLGTMNIQPRPGFLRCLDLLRSRGFRFTIGSLTETKQAFVLLGRSGLLKEFDAKDIVLAEHVEKPKPAPDVFLQTAKIMGIFPQEQLVFEDSPRGVQAALAAGSRAIGMPVYNKPEAICPLVNAGAIRIFMDWGEIDLIHLLENLSR